MTSSSTGPLLVTGLPRSGTSWVGKMLEAGGAAVYVNEPLNPRHPPGRSPGVLDADVEHAFQYICADNDAEWLPAFTDTVRLRYGLLAELRRNRGAYDLARAAKYLSAFVSGRLRGRRALLDDPYAVLSAGWFVERLGCRAVVLVREPCAFVGSWQRLRWTVDVRELLDQPLLLRDLPDSCVTAIRNLAGSNDRIDQAALLWRVTYDRINRLRPHLPGLVVRRYEDLAGAPEAGFRELYGELGIPWTRRAARRVRVATAPATRRQPFRAGARGPHAWSLRGGLSRTAYQPMDAAAALRSSRDRLTPEEMERVRRHTADVAALYYPGDTELAREGGRA